MRYFLKILIIYILTINLAFAGADGEISFSKKTGEVKDCFEKVNRATFAFNQVLDNTIFEVDQIGRSGFSIPYLDGSLSISRASRTFPQYLIFKPSMIMTAILLYYYWNNNNNLVNKLYSSNHNYKFRTFGILSAIFLAIHSIFLGIKFDIQIYKLFRRVVLLLFIIFELIAQDFGLSFI